MRLFRERMQQDDSPPQEREIQDPVLHTPGNPKLPDPTAQVFDMRFAQCCAVLLQPAQCAQHPGSLFVR